MNEYELLIQNQSNLYSPCVQEGIEWSTSRTGSPGKLTFKALIDDSLKIDEGNAVRFKWNNQKVFYGFIFSRKTDKNGFWDITAYDQLRYFKNKETYVYTNKRYDEVVKMIANDFKLRIGSLANTQFKIASKVEDNQTLFDIVQNAADATLSNTKILYVLYDDFGSLTLKRLEEMKTNVLISIDTGEDYSYTTSIDDNTYNQIKLIYDNDKTGVREVYISKNSSLINKWGKLQYYDTLKEGENGNAKADALLDLYSKKTRKLSITNAFGDVNVRAGSLVPVVMNVGDQSLSNYMLVETCKHSFTENEHWMDLTLRGGEYA